MWQGEYIRWNPIPNYEGARLYCEAVHDDWEGFRIWLRPEDKKSGMVIVRFESMLMYVNSDEGNRLSNVTSQEKMVFPHAFWKVEKSSLIKEFHRQSVGINEELKIKHFALLTCDDCIDILSVDEPTFETGEEQNA